jgi:transcriptional regulator with XRE-family HTH domain
LALLTPDVAETFTNEFMASLREMEKFGEKLRTLRERRGLSYRQLAASLETSHSHILNIETGKHKPSVDLIVRIVQFFGVSYDQLMDDDVQLEW